MTVFWRRQREWNAVAPTSKRACGRFWWEYMLLVCRLLTFIFANSSGKIPDTETPTANSRAPKKWPKALCAPLVGKAATIWENGYCPIFHGLQGAIVGPYCANIGYKGWDRTLTKTAPKGLQKVCPQSFTCPGELLAGFIALIRVVNTPPPRPSPWARVSLQQNHVRFKKNRRRP